MHGTANPATPVRLRARPPFRAQPPARTDRRWPIPDRSQRPATAATWPSPPRATGEPAGGWLDLSTGINPVPYPARPVPTRGLRPVARPATPSPCCSPPPGQPMASRTRRALIATPGSDSPSACCRMLAPPGQSRSSARPTAATPRRGGTPTRTVAELRASTILPADTAVVVVANPNNPDGRAIAPDALLDLAHRLGDARRPAGRRRSLRRPGAGHERWSASVETCRPSSCARSASSTACPGLRLGFVAGRPSDRDGWRPFSATGRSSGPGDRHRQSPRLATCAWRDGDARPTRRSDADAPARRCLRGTASPSSAARTCSRSSRTATPPRSMTRSPRQGIWTRAFAERPNWLRIGLPGSDADFARLDGALSRPSSWRR